MEFWEFVEQQDIELLNVNYALGKNWKKSREENGLIFDVIWKQKKIEYKVIFVWCALWENVLP